MGIPDKIQLVTGPNGFRVFIDGQELPYATIGGAKISTAKDDIASVTLTIPTMNVEIYGLGQGWPPPGAG